MKHGRLDEFISNPKRALYILSAPVIIAMFVQSMYNIVDTAFVGRLGAEAIAALTFAFPLFFVLMSLNSGIGIGVNSRISRYLGMRNKREAENTAIHGLLVSIALAILIFFLGVVTMKQLFQLLGATGSVLELSMQYMSIILIGVFFMFPSYVITSIFAAQGDTKTPMKVQVASLILNIILDPILIYYMGWGVRGAAIATVIAFLLSLILAGYYLRTKSHLHIRLECFEFRPEIVKEIFSVGLPASVTMLVMSVYMMFLNRFMAHFGTDYVAAFGIASRLESVAVMPMVALTMTMVTLVGMFYGAKRYDLIKKLSWYEIKVALAFTSAMGMIFFISPWIFLRIFTNDATLLAIGSAYMRIEVFTFPLMAISMSISRIMQGMGFGIPGLIINLIRIVFVAVPLAYVFVFILGLDYLSIPIAMVTGGIAASLTAFIWLKKELKGLGV